MTSPEHKTSCENQIERFLAGENPDRDHLESCEQCRQMIATIAAIKKDAAPANPALEFPHLKAAVMKRLKPVLKSKFAEERSESFLHSWFFKLALGAAAFVLLLSMTLPVLRQKAPDQTVVRNSLPIVLTQNFKISVNGQAEKEVSLDNPVSLFAGEAAQITLPDASTLKVDGPARLSIAPRGFHLASGFLTASVCKGKGTFVATTPHGQIEVLGTVFSCDSTAQKTVVKVIEGKVKVKPDQGSEQVLSAGETAEMHNEVSTGSETIPSIDSE